MKRYKYVILGGGVAAGYAAQEFAQQDVAPGQLAIITADSLPPYDRPPLSKGFLAGEKSRSEILLNETAFYRQHGITVKTQTRVKAVDFKKRVLHCERGPAIGFERLLIATGSEVRRLDIPGSDFKGLHYLRLMRDSEAIKKEIKKGRRAVVIGGGFIGMEVASVSARCGVNVTLVVSQDRMGSKIFTPGMSAWFQDYFEKRKVKILTGEKAVAFVGKESIQAVALSSGREEPADFVVAGIGVAPATGLFKKTPLEVNQGILANEFLEASWPEVWAAGDVCNYPDKIFQKRRCVDHWDNAVEQGRCAVRNMMGKPQPFIHVPYFFSDVFDLSYEFWGDNERADDVVYRGNIKSGQFSAWWLRKERLVAAFVMNRPDEERELAPKWIMERAKVSRRALKDERRCLRPS